MNGVWCLDCGTEIDESTLYHAVEIVDPDYGPDVALSERGWCPVCGDVWLRYASSDL